MFLKVDNVCAELMSSGRLCQATWPATQNAQLPSRSLSLYNESCMMMKCYAKGISRLRTIMLAGARNV